MLYEPFSIYGFKLEYPKGWSVELKRKSDGNRGDVVFYSPTKDKVSISWDFLERVKKRYPSLTKHGDEILKRIKKSYGVESVEVIERKELKVNEHSGVFMHLKATSLLTFFFRKRRVVQEFWSLHVYCEQTARYFVLYGSTRSDERSREQEDIFNYMRKTFRCHTE